MWKCLRGFHKFNSLEREKPMTLEDNRRICNDKLSALHAAITLIKPPEKPGNLFYDDVTAFWTQEAKLTGSFPPYNLLKNPGSTAFTLQLAIAGYGPEDVSVSVEDNHLLIKGTAEPESLDTDSIYVHKGIAGRSFTRSFTLGDNIVVKNVSYKIGILYIYMELNEPDRKKPTNFLINCV